MANKSYIIATCVHIKYDYLISLNKKKYRKTGLKIMYDSFEDGQMLLKSNHSNSTLKFCKLAFDQYTEECT